MSAFHEDPDQFIVPHLLRELKPDCLCAVCAVLREACEDGFSDEGDGNQQRSGLRGDPVAPRTVNGEARDHEIIEQLRADLARLTVERDELIGYNALSYDAMNNFRERAELAETTLTAVIEERDHLQQEKKALSARIGQTDASPRPPVPRPPTESHS